MRFDLAVNNGLIITADGEVAASIGIADGLIVAVQDSAIVDAVETIDAAGLTVLPGVVDGHIHFRDPAYPEKEDFTSGTRAAVTGGVTTVLEMPMSDVGTSTGERLTTRRGIIEPKTLIDFGLYGGAGQQSVHDIRGTAAAGAIAFKSFMREPYAARATNFEGTWVVDEGALYEVAREVASTGLVWSVHAENFQIVQALTGSHEAPQVTPESFVEVRPEVIERQPVSKLISFAKEFDARLHIAHITTAAGVDLVRKARADGVEVTCEVCIPHLIYAEDAISVLGPLGYFTPRLRGHDDQESLWAGLKDGTITMIASDHSAYTREDVSAGWNSGITLTAATATAGSASIEFMLPLVLTGALARGIPLSTVVGALTMRPAKLFGLWPKKGGISVGSDADLTIVDLNRKVVIDSSRMQSKAKLSAFEGMEIVGVPVHTLSRGTLVLRDGEVVGIPGHGRFLTRLTPDLTSGGPEVP